MVSEVRVMSALSINLVLRSALLRASRRTATGEVVPASILRDAVLRTAPQDEVRDFELLPVRSDFLHGNDPLAVAFRQQRIDGTPHLCSVSRHFIAGHMFGRWAATIELTAVYQSSRPIIQKEIGCAHGVKLARRYLLGIIEVRKRKPVFFGKPISRYRPCASVVARTRR